MLCGRLIIFQQKNLKNGNKLLDKGRLYLL